MAAPQLRRGVRRGRGDGGLSLLYIVYIVVYRLVCRVVYRVVCRVAYSLENLKVKIENMDVDLTGLSVSVSDSYN